MSQVGPAEDIGGAGIHLGIVAEVLNLGHFSVFLAQAEDRPDQLVIVVDEFLALEQYITPK